VTRMRMYVLAAVILFYCAVGVFALNNVGFDLWTLFLFGLLGYVMRSLGFPVVPVVLGVVLGSIAENSLARVVAISSDPTPFLTRPWSLFFILLALFSSCFHRYQKYRGQRRWTLVYVPAMLLALSVPVAMMGGSVRPVMAGVLIAAALGLLWRQWRRGWALAAAPDHLAQTLDE